MDFIPKYIDKLLAAGEGIELDFKQTLKCYSKIAKSIVSFANTNGGILLIGIRDNKTIAGVNTDEDLFVFENATLNYCKPFPAYTVKTWNINGKNILECTVKKGLDQPYYAKDDENKWWVYVRVADECLLASKTTVDFMKQVAKPSGIKLEMGWVELGILNLFKENDKLTLKEISKKLNISYRRASRVLVLLMSAKVVRSHTFEKTEFFTTF